MVVNIQVDVEALYQQFMGVKAPEVISKEKYGKAEVEILENGTFFYMYDGIYIHHGFSKAMTEDGRKIDTRQAMIVSIEAIVKENALGSCKEITCLYEQEELLMKQCICLYEEGEVTIQLLLKDKSGMTKTRYMAPFSTLYPDKKGKRLFLSLDQKMLQVPYDNDMWLRYESVVPHCGRKSYDVTAIYDEHTEEGLVIGALDYDVWKNAITWDAHDARMITAFSGVADEMTHDTCIHGVVEGEWVSSARFVIFWTEDIKQGMECFGDLCGKIRAPRMWTDGKVPFGWNSFSGLGMGLQLSHWEEAGDFIKEELPNYADQDGVSYINLDGAFGLDNERIKSVIQELHARGQKAGWYAAPCCWIPMLGDYAIEGTEYVMSDLYMKDHEGNVLPSMDGSIPLDTTHPAWEIHARSAIRFLVELDIDYIKIDFLTHGSLEGAHYDKKATGRMALNFAYDVLDDEIRKAEKEIFVSLSIAPLFPYYLGHARRACCDAFGHYDDTRYVLNALNYAWWTNRRLYQYNDPDHIALYYSVIDGREITTEEEARSRYCSAVISGTVMMLSDNYGPVGDEGSIEAARARTKKIANNPHINEIARWGQAFIPVEITDGTTPYYYLHYNGRKFVAIFNFTQEQQLCGCKASKFHMPENSCYMNLWTGVREDYTDRIDIMLEDYNAVILEIM